MSAKILVVDDEPGIREVCQRSLSHSGYEVTTVASGLEAVQRLNERWDVILTDITMPGGIDGLELLRRSNDSGRTDVVLMTAYPGMQTAIDAIRNKAQDYLIKPFSIDQLEGTIQRCLQKKEMAPNALDKFVSPEVSRYLHEHPKDFWQHGENREVTVLFADVRQFTPFAANVAPEEAAHAINEILACVIQAVQRNGGILNKFTGDGVLAVFGAPEAIENHACAAAKAAIEARDAVMRLAEKRKAAGLTPLHLGFGINTGEVIAGCLGTEDRMEYSVLGHAVNLAARIQDSANPDEILLGPATAADLSCEFEIGFAGKKEFAGITGSTSVFRLAA